MSSFESSDWISALQRLQLNATPAALVTIIMTKGSTPRDIGTKLVVTKTDFYGTIGGGQLEELVIEKARQILKNNLPPERVPYPLCLKANQCCGGFVEVFIETFNTGPHLVLFGAGHVAQAIAQVLVDTPFKVHLVDQRKEWLSKAPASVIQHLDSGINLVEKWPFGDVSKLYAAVMTFDHNLDQNLVENLLDKDLKYLGLIGSEIKWRRFQKNFIEKGISVAVLNKVTSPIGLPIGGKTPKEVAISFAAEILQLHNTDEKKQKTNDECSQDAII